MNQAGAASLAVSAAVLGYVGWSQLRRRPVATRLVLPLVLIVLGAASLAARTAGHPMPPRADAILAASLVFDAAGLAGVRAHTIRLGSEGGRIWRQGTWVTAALWLAGAAIHAALDAAAGTGGASYLLYLGVTVCAQRLVLHGRVRALAAGPVPRAGGASSRHTGRALPWLLIVVFCLLGVMGGFLSFFAAAFLTAAPVILLTAAVAVCFLIAFAGARQQGRKLAWRASAPAAAALAATALLAWVLSLTVLAPWPSSAVARMAPPAPAGLRYWNLGTGSRIAYLEVPAQGAARATPVVFVGGGPGEEDVANRSEVRFFSQLAGLGYDVYFYDQVGSGLSARLADPAEYTLRRAVDDLAAIQAQIGARQVILLGASWGGTLVANYMAAHPTRVAKAVLTSPAPIDYAQWSSADDNILSVLPPAVRRQVDGMLTGSPRFLAWYALGEIDARAAHNLVPDREADAFFNTLLQLVAPGTVCDPAHLPHQPQQGNGFYDNIFTTRNAQMAGSVADPLAVLRADRTPVLIMTGSCNYVKWPVEWQYRATFPDATLLYFSGAGHEIYLDRPSLYLASIEDFLAGRALPLQPWTSAAPPPGLGR